MRVRGLRLRDDGGCAKTGKRRRLPAVGIRPPRHNPNTSPAARFRRSFRDRHWTYETRRRRESQRRSRWFPRLWFHRRPGTSSRRWRDRSSCPRRSWRRETDVALAMVRGAAEVLAEWSNPFLFRLRLQRAVRGLFFVDRTLPDDDGFDGARSAARLDQDVFAFDQLL